MIHAPITPKCSSEEFDTNCIKDISIALIVAGFDKDKIVSEAKKIYAQIKQ